MCGRLSNWRNICESQYSGVGVLVMTVGGCEELNPRSMPRAMNWGENQLDANNSLLSVANPKVLRIVM